MTNLSPGPLNADSVSGLSYRLMQPQPSSARRCLVLLHGVGSNELSVASLAQGVEDDTLVVLAQGPLTLGPQQFAWFQVAFTSSGPRIVRSSRTS
jgi:phospholipase/carboxylesterase